MTGPEHHPSVGDLLLPAINFGIFAFLAVRYLRGPAQEFFRNRTARLREALEAGARARREAEALRDALARDRAALPAERERLAAEVRATAARERESIIADGTRVAERLRDEARLLADSEVAAARQAVRVEVIEEAVRHATRLIRESVEPADQERLVREFVERAGEAA